MSTVLTEIRRTIVPGPEGRDGPLPPMLVAMTVVTGLVDAFSYLVLGHVFVANMTGNVVFLGFALAGAPGFSFPVFLAALASFGAGALVGGQLGSRLGRQRGRLLSTAASIQAVVLLAAVVLTAVARSPGSGASRYALVALLAIAMGIQNAAARRLAVPDLTTTVLTLTITGIAADSVAAGGGRSAAGRRVIAVVAMLAGALVGAVLVIRHELVAPLVIAVVAISLVAGTSRWLARSDPAWTRPAGG
ncbi:MAG: YoaK family protein [Candidatus Dormibacteria bacterium]